jgi:hypothetical protein
MVMILTIGAITHWVQLHGKTKAVMGSSVLVAVFAVWALPLLYGPRYLKKSDIECVEENDQCGDTAQDRLLPQEDDCDEGDHLQCSTNKSDRETEEKPFVSFFGRHVPLKEVMCHWRSHMIMLMFMFISGSGLLVINNVQVCMA